MPINVLCFQVFASESEHFFSRAWLLDPIETQTAASPSVERLKQAIAGDEGR